MKRLLRLLSKIFNTRVEQIIEAKHTKETTIYQTTNFFNFLFPGIVLFLVLGAILFLGYSEYQKSLYDYSPMSSGNLNIVITPFSDHSQGLCLKDKNIGKLISSAFYSELISSEYSKSAKIQPEFRSPNKIPALDGNTLEEMAISAEKLSRQINAHIVIYGVVTCTEITNKPSATVLFFVAPTGFVDAQELIGEFEFSSGALYGSLTSGQEFLNANENLRLKIIVIENIINALGLYLGEDYEAASIAISNAIASQLWESEGGIEVVYIIAGNIKTRHANQLIVDQQEILALREIEEAQLYYNLANEISQNRGLGTYARSYIGLASIDHFYATYKSRTSCELEDININKLLSEKSLLNKAYNAENAPITADVYEKIAFNTAQIDLTLYSIEYNQVSLEEIENNYDIVISSYNKTTSPNLNLRELAAHSYSGLGFVNWYRGKNTEVVNNFKQAINITDSPSLQASYLKSLGDFYFFNEDYEHAITYYSEAENLSQEFKLKKAKCEVDIKNLIIEAKEKMLNQ